jgi:hypothetical protein
MRLTTEWAKVLVAALTLLGLALYALVGCADGSPSCLLSNVIGSGCAASCIGARSWAAAEPAAE